MASFPVGWHYNIANDCMVSPDGKTTVPMHSLVDYDYSPGAMMMLHKQQAAANAMSISRPEIKERKYTPYEKLAARLDMAPGDDFPADGVHIVVGPNKTFVFVVVGDKAIILEDDNGIFPSDSMVAQFRLMQD